MVWYCCFYGDPKPDNEPDIEAASRSESTGLMEPMVVGESSRHRTPLTDLAVELTGKAVGFRRSLPEGVLTALADLVRAMNCYYSNLFEGHDTHPVDIERALKNDYSADTGKRNLQLEAKSANEIGGRQSFGRGVGDTAHPFQDSLGPRNHQMRTRPR